MTKAQKLAYNIIYDFCLNKNKAILTWAEIAQSIKQGYQAWAYFRGSASALQRSKNLHKRVL